MSLKNKISDDLKLAMREKNTEKLSVLRMLSSSIKNREIEKKLKLIKANQSGNLDDLAVLNDEEILATISTEVKRRKDSIKQYEEGGRAELAQQEKKELDILAVYLPEQMGEEEIRKLVVDAIQKSGASSIKEIGKVMALLMPSIKGKADGNLVNNIVKELLGQ